MPYVEMMALPVREKDLAAYKKLVRGSAKAWKRCGALAYHELIEDDVKPGKVTSYPQSLQLQKGELVAAAYIVFKSKASRNAAWKKFMNDPFAKGFSPETVPFDMKRMYFGGFKTLVQF